MSKTLISIRLDDDLLAWYRAAWPQGYQTKMQAVLRDHKQRCELRREWLLGRAQQVFVQYHARCFWHMRRDLKVTPALIPLIREGLRKFGGLEGMRLAAELGSSDDLEGAHANH